MNASFLWATNEADYGPMPDENKWNLIRAYRNQLLAQSDWTQLGDTPFTAAQKDAWTAYRQALRDLPQDFGNPGDVNFPEVP